MQKYRWFLVIGFVGIAGISFWLFTVQQPADRQQQVISTYEPSLKAKAVGNRSLSHSSNRTIAAKKLTQQHQRTHDDHKGYQKAEHLQDAHDHQDTRQHLPRISESVKAQVTALENRSTEGLVVESFFRWRQYDSST